MKDPGTGRLVRATSLALFASLSLLVGCAEEPSAEPRYRRIGDLGQLVRLVQEIG